MNRRILTTAAVIASFCVLLGVWFLYSEIYSAEVEQTPAVAFTVEQGEAMPALAARLEAEGVIRNAWLFRKYLSFKGIDRSVRAGTFTVEAPMTLARVAAALQEPSAGERTITIIPGWDLRDVGEYFIREGITTAGEWFVEAGPPAHMTDDDERGCQEWLLPFLRENIPVCVGSIEGYLAPDTYRVYADASIDEIVEKLVQEQEKRFTPEIKNELKRQNKTVHEILTMASILEKEVRTLPDKKKVADIFWRRLEINWALQADSTVHYAVGKKGNVFTTAEDRAVDSLWNTYKYPGLPPGPISMPGKESVEAAVFPESNEYWYFLTTPDGEVKYAKTLEEHAQNKRHL